MNYDSDSGLCYWTLYTGKRCTKNSDEFFCSRHTRNALFYKFLKKDSRSTSICSTKKDIRFIPKSRDHINHVKNILHINQDNTEVNIFLSGITYKGDISNNGFILIDNIEYYYVPEKGQPKAKDLRIVMTNQCNIEPVISINGVLYCNKCYYQKMKNAPKLSILKKFYRNKDPEIKDYDAKESITTEMQNMKDSINNYVLESKKANEEDSEEDSEDSEDAKTEISEN